MAWPDFLSRRHLQFRIVALFLGIVLLVQAASLLLIGSSIGVNARAAVNAELRTGERVFERLLKQACEGERCRRIDAALLREMRQLTAIDVAVLGRRADNAPWELLQTTLGDEDAAALRGGWHRAGQVELPATGRVDTHPQPQGRDGGGQQTVAVLLRSLDEATAPWQRLQWTLLAFTALAIVVSAAFSVLTARRIATPLRALTRSAKRLGQGDYEQPVEVQGDHEIRELARSFEAMRQAVRTRDADVRRLAYEDALTKLPNREKFRSLLRQAIAHARAQTEPCAVVMLDLDRVKHVNDVLGHRFGDRLLRHVARRLKQEVRAEHDVVARLGGDEYALLLPGADVETALALARRILQAFEHPITLDDHTVDLGAGIGVACCPDHGIDAESLLSHAEMAMYAAKRQQAGVVVYEAALDSSSEETLSLLTELRSAVDGGELRLYLQPKIALATGQVIGAEALVRWEHPHKGLLTPIRFVPFAERTGFIRMLTGWMIERCATLLQVMQARGVPFKLSVNLSTRDLLDAELPGKLRRLVSEQRIDPGSLCLEITESAIMDDPQRAQHTLEHLNGMGFKLAIDDFGTGYSSLAYLKRLPVDELKIDQSFVLNMERDIDDAKIVRSTVDLAHNLGLTVVAEGVETAKAWKLLQALGCDEAQGYFVAKPMPEALFVEWLKDWRAPQLQSVRLDSGFNRLMF